MYYEANGHGTVLFHPDFVARLVALGAPSAGLSATQEQGRRRLLASVLLINQAIGDALSDAMFVEAALACAGWSVVEWDALYEDLPSKQMALPVRDRTLVNTTEDETRVTSPAALQAAIDALVATVPQGRAFVRPSGTEDVVRVYAEAATLAAAVELAERVAEHVYVHAGRRDVSAAGGGHH